MSKAITARLPDKVVENLDRVARESDRSRSYVVQKAIESYLADFADLQVAIDRLRDKSDPVVSAEDMRKSLGL